MTQANRLTSYEVQEAKFTTVRLADGYDMAAVDSLLDRLVEALTGYERGDGQAALTADGLASVSFATTKLRLGYRIDDVQELLDRGAETLRAYEKARRPASAAGATYSSTREWGMSAQDLIKRLQELQAALRTRPESPLVTARTPDGRTYMVTAVGPAINGLEITLTQLKTL